MLYKKLIAIALLFILAPLSYSQTEGAFQIKWLDPAVISFSNEKKINVLNFEGADFLTEDQYSPRFHTQIPLGDNIKDFTCELKNTTYQELTEKELSLIKNTSIISTEIKSLMQVSFIQKKAFGNISFLPFRKNINSGKLEKLISFSISITPTKQILRSGRGIQSYTANSVLQSGKWYKIGIGTDGIYKITFSFLQNLGMDIKNINPRNIKIYGNGGGMLPELNSAPRYDDLNENAIFVEGENDGVFNENDYILFWGKGQDYWTYDANTCPKYKHNLNLHADSAYYFITVGSSAGKRITPQGSSSSTPTHYVASFDDYTYHEKETTNFLKSGKQWFGEYFENNPSATFPFSFSNIDASTPATINIQVASRSIGSNASYYASCQSGSTSMSIPGVTSDQYTSNYAELGSSCFSFTPSSPSLVVNFTKQTANAVAWLDFIEVNVRRQLTMTGEQMTFRDALSLGMGNIAQYNVSSSSPIQIWDITDLYNVKSQTFIKNGTSYQFIQPASTLRQFVAFTGKSFNTPKAYGEVVNQNLHALSNKRFIIITHPTFYQEALQIANYHQNKDGLSSVVVTTEQVYNEFSSGAQDVSALRNFVKMFYDKATNVNEIPKYLLLFGDGSYDNKKRLSNNTNYIPTYQSDNSLFTTSSYTSDDFYGLLDDGEGLWTNGDAVDIGIGRIPASSKKDAQTALNKILNYTQTSIASTENTTTSKSPFGNWRNIVCFIADDGDNNTHVSQADQQATLVDTTYNNYNIDKIYLDAYAQETTPGGNRYPTVNEAIERRINQGALIINWTGHGSEGGLAHEGILSYTGMKELSNANKLFLFITASCEVSRYDNPGYTSAGEYAFFNAGGGAIALFSTVRVVYASPNFLLNKSIYQSVLKPINNQMPALGDVYLYAKTQSGGNSINSRNFALLGDPALKLAYPKYSVTTDTINLSPVTPSSSDTIKALSLVTISGHLTDENGISLNTYNGVIYPTVYDKYQSLTTLSNKGSAESPPFNFKLQKNILFNGKASVRNGYFRFSFVVPKDIAYQYGPGRISYYAENGSTDASGHYEKIIIGGTDENAPPDNLGPEMRLYMNNDKFVFGGLTNDHPDIYSVLYDDNGINIVGNAVGHDITAILDANTKSPINLNDYYKADLNTYKSGTIRYPLSDLSEGKHSLKLKAWDVYNNSSETYTEFIVSKSAQVALKHVLNYPNPFTTKTSFFFEHNQANISIEVLIQIFTVSGKLVKTIDQIVYSDGFRTEGIDWDGKDDFGDNIGRGVYIYRVKVRTSDNGSAEKYEKLVILN
jgi:hypothetical protein